jgi:hypothetical protein
VKSKAKWFVTDFKELIDALWDSSCIWFIFLNGEVEMSQPVLTEIKIVTVNVCFFSLENISSLTAHLDLSVCIW